MASRFSGLSPIDDERGFARFARQPRPVEIGGDPRTHRLDGEAGRGAGERGETLQAQHVVGADRLFDGLEEMVLAGDAVEA